MFALYRTGPDGKTLVGVRDTEGEARLAALMDAIRRMTEASPSLQQRSRAVMDGRLTPDKALTSNERQTAGHAAMAEYTVERLG